VMDEMLLECTHDASESMCRRVGRHPWFLRIVAPLGLGL
jgi:hypothetical protein